MSKRYLLYFAWSGSLVMLLAACASAEPRAASSPMPTLAVGAAAPVRDDRGASEAPPALLAQAAPASATTTGPAAARSETSAPLHPAAENAKAPMLVYTAQISLAVYEVGKGLLAVERLGSELGGYLARRDDASVTIRVPVARFQEAVDRIAASGDVLHRNVVAQDVTEEFRDVEIRLKNALAMRERLEQLLQKASKVEESITVERELARVTQEIEQMQGRLKLLSDRAAYSTITASFEVRRSEAKPDAFRLPVPWLDELGIGRLLRL
jgi:hypothetical protein